MTTITAECDRCGFRLTPLEGQRFNTKPTEKWLIENGWEIEEAEHKDGRYNNEHYCPSCKGERE